MDIFERLGITPYINAHDTYTVYGGSRMAPNTLAAMAEIARHFVDMEQLQRALGQKIARLTRNEGAYITNGASGGLLLAACVCMARGSMYRYSRLPDTAGVPDEIIVQRAQRNAYDKAIAASGARVVEVGDADETPPYELEGAISENTAAVFVFASALYERGSLPLVEVARIAHAKGVPVVVDAAAQLPPVENLWGFTAQGADLVIFSGGKTLCGPQDSGLILGRADFIEDCVRFGAPVHGVCRSSKAAREAMVGLYVALENYLALDQAENTRRLLAIDERLARAMEATGCARAEIVHRGPVGQAYPRVFGYLKEGMDPHAVAQAMRARHIYIGVEAGRRAIYLSPLNLAQDEVGTVEQALAACLREAAPE